MKAQIEANETLLEKTEAALAEQAKAGADVPILKQCAIALGVPCPEFNKRPDKPWNGYDYHDARNSDAHMDILDIIGGYSGAAKPSLNDLACGDPASDIAARIVCVVLPGDTRMAGRSAGVAGRRVGLGVCIVIRRRIRLPA